MSNYKVKYNSDETLEISQIGFTCTLYRVPYRLMESGRSDIHLVNENIVYLLLGRNTEGRDCLYVGMSSNGLKNRPTGHKDKNIPWEYCFFLASNDQITLNGSKAEYIEDYIAQLINNSKRYDSKTEVTSHKKSDPDEKEACNQRILPPFLEMLDIAGIHIKEPKRTDLFQFKEKITIPQENNVATVCYESMDMGAELTGWLHTIDETIQSIDPSVKPSIKVESKYISFKKNKRVLIYCYPKKTEQRIEVFFYGGPEKYSDERVVMRPENRHNKPCDSMFQIRNTDDLKAFNTFAEIAINSR